MLAPSVTFILTWFLGIKCSLLSFKHNYKDRIVMPKHHKEDEDAPEAWEVQDERPEDQFSSPDGYWTPEAITKLLKAKGQARIQHDLAVKALNNLAGQFPGILEIEGSSPIALDIGCGLGFASDTLVGAGFTAIGIDIIPEMLQVSSERDEVLENSRRSRYHRVLASAANMPVRGGMVDFAISISALQWLDTKDEIVPFAAELDRVISSSGALAFQHYPRNSEEMMKLGTAIKQSGFEGGILLENVKNPRKRKIFLLARRQTAVHSPARE